MFAHRTKKQLLSRDGGRERRVARAAAVEVGADPDYDWSVVVENRVDETRSLIVVMTQREELFELVHDEK